MLHLDANVLEKNSENLRISETFQEGGNREGKDMFYRSQRYPRRIPALYV